MKELVVAASTGLLFAYQAIRDGRRDPGEWERQLRVLSSQGFTAVDLSELWLPLADLTDLEVAQLAAAVKAAGMEIAGVSIIDVDLASAAMLELGRTKVRRAITVTAMLGARYLSIGFHSLPGDQGMPPRWAPSDEDELERVGRELTSLTRIAAERGVELTLEMFERGILDRSANVLAIIAAAGEKSLGANPDLANLLRAPWPLVEDWPETLRAVLPFMNYWHVKNGVRTALPDGCAIYHPTDMQHGLIDYRSAIQMAVRAGFRGPLVIEHYGGDAIAQAASGRSYLCAIIDEICAYEGLEIKELRHQ
ncbi:MAG TPA: TIM barrel protein [Sphingomonas sp.]